MIDWAKKEGLGRAGAGKRSRGRAAEVPPPRVPDGRELGAALVQYSQTEICHFTLQTRAQLRAAGSCHGVM